MKKARADIQDLSNVIAKIDKIDNELEQLERLMVKLTAQRMHLAAELRQTSQRSGIELEDKPGRARS